MESFTLGFPPEGRSFDPIGTNQFAMPESVRKLVIERFEIGLPDGYLLAFVDRDADVFGFYSQSGECCRRLSEVSSIVLYFQKPAKGHGFLLVGDRKRGGKWPDCYLESKRYSATLHAWIRERVEKLAKIADLEFKESSVGFDV